MVYVPSKPPAVSSADGQALAAYLDDEMKSVAAGLRTSDSILFSVLHKAPLKPRQGQLVYVDGTNWNPGSGEGLYVYSAAGSWVWLEDNPVIPTIPPLPRGHIFGLTMSTAGSSSTFSVAAGLACDSTGAQMINLSSSMAKTTSAWAAGTGNGALDTGSILASQSYWGFVIENPTSGAVDVLITKAVAATTPVPTLPTGYTIYRYIGSMKTNGSSQWTKFVQIGDEFLWDVAVQDVNGIASTTSAVATTLSVPLGVPVRAIISTRNSANTAGAACYISSLDASDQAAGGGLATTISTTASNPSMASLIVRTNTSAQVRVRSNGVAALIYILTIGWIDDRGRNA